MTDRTGTRPCPEHRRAVTDPVAPGGRRAAVAPLGPRPARSNGVPHRHLGPVGPAPCRRSGARVRRRRLGVAAVVAAALGLLAAPIWGHPTPLGVTPPSGVVRTVTVAPGDTLASIASRTEPGRDRAVVVAELRAELGGAPLTPGMRLQLP